MSMESGKHLKYLIGGDEKKRPNKKPFNTAPQAKKEAKENKENKDNKKTKFNKNSDKKEKKEKDEIKRVPFLTGYSLKPNDQILGVVSSIQNGKIHVSLPFRMKFVFFILFYVIKLLYTIFVLSFFHFRDGIRIFLLCFTVL